MDKNERNTMITNIVNFNRAVLMTNGKIKNREYLEKYRNHLDLMLKKQLDKESADYRNELTNVSDEDLKRINYENEEQILLSASDQYDPDYDHDEYDDFFD